MKRTIVLIIIACLSLLALTAYGRTSQSAGHWEYKQSCNLKESEMNKLGAEGWELVTSASAGGTVTCLFYKRPK